MEIKKMHLQRHSAFLSFTFAPYHETVSCNFDSSYSPGKHVFRISPYRWTTMTSRYSEIGTKLLEVNEKLEGAREREGWRTFNFRSCSRFRSQLTSSAITEGFYRCRAGWLTKHQGSSLGLTSGFVRGGPRILHVSVQKNQDFIIPPLPDVFGGVKLVLPDSVKENRSELERYFIAYPFYLLITQKHASSQEPTIGQLGCARCCMFLHNYKSYCHYVTVLYLLLKRNSYIAYLSFNGAVSTTRLFSINEIGDSKMIFGEMRPRIRHRLPGIHLMVGENLGKNPTRSDIFKRQYTIWMKSPTTPAYFSLKKDCVAYDKCFGGTCMTLADLFRGVIMAERKLKVIPKVQDSEANTGVFSVEKRLVVSVWVHERAHIGKIMSK
ncbi:hypothetical protein ANN_04358 [Periplaneta americana]|uniref:DNA ligase 3 BRCT domain-containing protein n=1 Tax=Periplaneta americana TaxID=6978 RepID=A0ABQ8T8C0_PERAM|nr:hypothetical protein ANN_04358 [Periplaneta americana]